MHGVGCATASRACLTPQKGDFEPFKSKRRIVFICWLLSFRRSLSLYFIMLITSSPLALENSKVKSIVPSMKMFLSENKEEFIERNRRHEQQLLPLPRIRSVLQICSGI